MQHEQIHLRKQIEDILTENKTINTKLESLKTATVQIAGDSRDDATREKFTNDALLNVKKQIDFLEAVSVITLNFVNLTCNIYIYIYVCILFFRKIRN